MLKLDHIHYTYPGANKPAISDITLDIPDQTMTTIIGPNGAGKSTLLRILCGILKPDNGRVLLDGQLLKHPEFASKVAYVPQLHPEGYESTVMDLVATGRTPHADWFGRLTRPDLEAIETAIDQCDLAHLKNQPVNQISGGELQRVWIARALAQDTPYLILDEPSAHLDIRHQVEIFSLLNRLRTNHYRTIILSVHDLNLAANFSTHVLLLNAGYVFSIGTVEHVMTEAELESVFKTPIQINRINGITISPDLRSIPDLPGSENKER